jgi:hypothetical protein
MGLLNGFGKIASVGTQAQRFVVNETQVTFYANQVSVFNNGSTTVYAAVNISLDQFNTLSSSIPNNGRAIPIATGQSFSFAGQGNPPISSLCVVSSSGTNEVFIGAF